MTRKEMDNVDVLRKAKKIEDIENYMFAIRRNLDFHFIINSKSVDNPYYKLDALVWSSIFHEKVPRYSPQVYKMSEYIVQHFNYLKSLKYTDIESGMIDWNANRIPFNFMDKVIKINPPLTREEFEREQDSPFKVKKYHYNYRRPEEITDECLQKTFANLVTVAHFHNKEKSVSKEYLNIDNLQSDEREKITYDMKRKLDQMSELPSENESFFKKVKDLTTKNQYSIWQRNLMMPLHDQLRE